MAGERSISESEFGELVLNQLIKCIEIDASLRAYDDLQEDWKEATGFIRHERKPTTKTQREIVVNNMREFQGKFLDLYVESSYMVLLYDAYEKQFPDGALRGDKEKIKLYIEHFRKTNVGRKEVILEEICKAYSFLAKVDFNSGPKIG